MASFPIARSPTQTLSPHVGVANTFVSVYHDTLTRRAGVTHTVQKNPLSRSSSITGEEPTCLSPRHPTPRFVRLHHGSLRAKAGGAQAQGLVAERSQSPIRINVTASKINAESSVQSLTPRRASINSIAYMPHGSLRAKAGISQSPQMDPECRSVSPRLGIRKSIARSIHADVPQMDPENSQSVSKDRVLARSVARNVCGESMSCPIHSTNRTQCNNITRMQYLPSRSYIGNPVNCNRQEASKDKAEPEKLLVSSYSSLGNSVIHMHQGTGVPKSAEAPEYGSPRAGFADSNIRMPRTCLGSKAGCVRTLHIDLKSSQSQTDNALASRSVSPRWVRNSWTHCGNLDPRTDAAQTSQNGSAECMKNTHSAEIPMCLSPRSGIGQPVACIRFSALDREAGIAQSQETCADNSPSLGQTRWAATSVAKTSQSDIERQDGATSPDVPLRLSPRSTPQSSGILTYDGTSIGYAVSQHLSMGPEIFQSPRMGNGFGESVSCPIQKSTREHCESSSAATCSGIRVIHHDASKATSEVAQAADPGSLRGPQENLSTVASRSPRAGLENSIRPLHQSKVATIAGVPRVDLELLPRTNSTEIPLPISPRCLSPLRHHRIWSAQRGVAETARSLSPAPVASIASHHLQGSFRSPIHNATHILYGNRPGGVKQVSVRSTHGSSSGRARHDTLNVHSESEQLQTRADRRESAGSTDASSFSGGKQQDGLKLAVFDFDCTLTSSHVFASLAGVGKSTSPKLTVPPPYARTETGQLERLRELDADPDWGSGVFALRAFGGPSRVEQLRCLLEALRNDSVECMILSRGMVRVIRRCLEQVDLLSFFSHVLGSEGCSMGSTDYDDALTVNNPLPTQLGHLPDKCMRYKVETLQRVMEERNLNFDQTLFVDDEFADIDENARSLCKTIHVSSGAGILEHEMALIKTMLYKGDPRRASCNNDA